MYVACKRRDGRVSESTRSVSERGRIYKFWWKRGHANGGVTMSFLTTPQLSKVGLAIWWLVPKHLPITQ